MNRRRLAILAIVTLAAVVGAVITAQYRAPQTSVEKELLFPGLRDRINDVAEVKLEGKGKQLTLARNGERWGIVEADGYPAHFGKVKQLIVGAAELRTLDTKTSNPELYSRLGVEDPDARGADSVLVTLNDTSASTIAQLIAGHDRKSSSPGDRPGLYVRIPGNDTALLVEGRLDVSMDTPDWLERDIFTVSGDRIRSIELNPGAGAPVHITREQEHGALKLTGLPPESPEPSEIIVGRMATVLEDVFIDSARVRTDVEFTGAAAVVVVRTYDGLVVTVEAEQIDGQPLAAFSFDYDAAAAQKSAAAEAAEAVDGDADAAPAAEVRDVQAEAQELQARLGEWAFVMPRFKFDLFRKTMQDFVAVSDADAASAD